MKFAVQLYSVRDHIENGEDLLNILDKVKEIGFDGVEFAGYQGVSAEKLRERCDELGLTIVGTHLGLGDFEKENLEIVTSIKKAGEVELPADKEIVMPGDQVTFKVKLLAPVAMNDQDRFAIREGGKTVGSGVITKVIK